MQPDARSRSRPTVGVSTTARGGGRVYEATQKAALKLLAHRDGTGGLHRPCASRAIESALALHLLRGVPRFGEHAARVRAFCRGFWEAAHAGAPVHPLADIDHAVSLALVATALEIPERKPLVDAVHARLSAFAHPSQQRKSRLFAVLLAALDPACASDGLPRGASAPATVDQTWTRLLMLAAQVIDSAGRSSDADTDRSIEELATSQRPDGSWESHVLLTLVALIAIAKAGRHPQVLDRGHRFLVRELRADGGIPFVPDVDVWLTALTGFALTHVAAPAPDLDPLADFIARHQLPSGAWAFRPGVETADADDTGMCVLFLQRWRHADYARHVERGRRALLTFRNADGGFSTYVAGAPSESEITARAIMVMASCAGAYAPEVDAAVRWLDGAQREDGSFPIEWTLCPYYPISQVLSALSAIPFESERARRIRIRSVQHLLAAQNADGGWGAAPRGASQPLPTAYALIGLCAAHDEAASGPIAAGTAFLIAQQRPDGGFESPPDALGPRPFVFEMDLFPTAYALLALAAVMRSQRGRRLE